VPDKMFSKRLENVITAFEKYTDVPHEPMGMIIGFRCWLTESIRVGRPTSATRYL